MRNSKQGINGDGERKQRVKVYSYYDRITGRRRSSPAKTKSFVNEAVKWEPSLKAKSSVVDGAGLRAATRQCILLPGLTATWSRHRSHT